MTTAHRVPFGDISNKENASLGKTVAPKIGKKAPLPLVTAATDDSENGPQQVRAVFCLMPHTLSLVPLCTDGDRGGSY